MSNQNVVSIRVAGRIADRVAVVAGASGLIGQYLLRELLESDSYSQVIALVRTPLKIANPKLHQVQVDFANLNNVSVVTQRGEFDGTGVHKIDLFCTLGTTIKKAGSQSAFRAVDHDAVLGFAKWRKACGASGFFLVTALGADSHSAIFYNQVKGQIENNVAALGFERLCIFRPSLLLGPRAERRPLEHATGVIAGVLSPVFRLLLRGPLAKLGKYQPIQAQVIARTMVRAALSAPSGMRILESDEIENWV